MPANRTSAIKRRRRTAAEISDIREVIFNELSRDNPMTCRQLFYRLVSNGTIDKTENEYRTTVCRLLKEMRLATEVPYQWVADFTRWMRKPDTQSSLTSMLQRCAETYRRDLWNSLPVRVEIWLEKDALAGVLYEVTGQYDVPLMVTRGYPSLSFLYEAADTIAGFNKPTYLYYFGDHDPSGVDIPRTVEKRLREFAPYDDISFERVAVTPEQIAELNLQTRPTKRKDSRSKKFKGESVEVDAIPPTVLKQLVEDCVVQHIDQHELARVREAERAERETLRTLVNSGWMAEATHAPQ